MDDYYIYVFVQADMALAEQFIDGMHCVFNGELATVATGETPFGVNPAVGSIICS